MTGWLIIPVGHEVHARLTRCLAPARVQEATAQEDRRQGRGSGGELPAQIPAGQGAVSEGRVPDLLSAAWTGTGISCKKGATLVLFMTQN